MAHRHLCRLCQKPFECEGEWRHNYDGWPSAVCSSFHEREINVCDVCESQREADAKADLANEAEA